MILDPSGLTPPERYRLMISAVVPRPIAWVTTLSGKGVVNAAPFSFFSGISASPPLVGVCVGKRRDGTDKDTLANSKATGEMVVNVVSRDLADRMVATSRDFPPGVSEVEEVGLATAPAEVVAPPLLAEAPVSLECVVDRILDFGRTEMIVGRVERFHVRDELWSDGAVDFAGLRPVGRLGGQLYLDPVDGVFELPRP